MTQQFGNLSQQLQQQSDKLDERLKAERAETTKQLKKLNDDWQERFRLMRESLQRDMSARPGGGTINAATLETAENYNATCADFFVTPTMDNARKYVKTLTPAGIRALSHHLDKLGKDDFPSFMSNLEKIRKRVQESRSATVDTIATVLVRSPCQLPKFDAISQIERDQRTSTKPVSGVRVPTSSPMGNLPPYMRSMGAAPMGPTTNVWTGIPHMHGRGPHDHDALHKPTQNKEKAAEAVNAFLYGKPDSSGLTLTTIRRALGGVHAYQPTNLSDRSQFVEALAQLQNHIHKLDAQQPGKLKRKDILLQELVYASKLVSSIDVPAEVEQATKAWQEGIRHESSFAGAMFKTTVALFRTKKVTGKSMTSTSTSPNTRRTPESRLCALCKQPGHLKSACPYTYNGKLLPETIICNAFNMGTCKYRSAWQCARAHICSICRTPAATHPRTQCQKHLH